MMLTLALDHMAPRLVMTRLGRQVLLRTITRALRLRRGLRSSGCRRLRRHNRRLVRRITAPLALVMVPIVMRRIVGSAFRHGAPVQELFAMALFVGTSFLLTRETAAGAFPVIRFDALLGERGLLLDKLGGKGDADQHQNGKEEHRLEHLCGGGRGLLECLRLDAECRRWDG